MGGAIHAVQLIVLCAHSYYDAQSNRSIGGADHMSQALKTILLVIVHRSS